MKEIVLRENKVSKMTCSFTHGAFIFKHYHPLIKDGPLEMFFLVTDIETALQEYRKEYGI